MQRGVEIPFVVSKIPGDSLYTLQAGGNTRLEILQKLHENDVKQFKKVPCILKDWHGEAEALIAHLQENDIRGDLMFIEKAQAVMALRDMLAVEIKNKKLTQRNFSKFLREKGFGISQTLISYMEYAVHRLYPLMPVALDAGLGKNSVQQIRSLERTAETIWNQYSTDGFVDFTEMFDSLCKRHDQVDWDYENLKYDVENELTQATDFELHTLKWMLEERFDGREFTPAKTTVTDQQETLAQPKRVKTIQVDESTSDDASRAKNAQRLISRNRKRLADAAVELAREFDMDRFILPTTTVGFGYIMIDVPAKRANRAQILIWKLLAACCEQSRLNKRTLLPFVEENSRLYRGMQSSRVHEILRQLPETDMLDSFAKLRSCIGSSVGCI